MVPSKSPHAYVDGPPSQVPGFASLHRMTNLLLAETMPPTGQVLVLGAGGGLELKAFADFAPGWSFDGVDPSAEMLEIARATLGSQGNRVKLHNGYIDAAPRGPFDAATCLLTFHFVPRDQRLETLRQIHQRLRSGAPFVVAHISIAAGEPDRSTWLKRHVAFGSTDAVDPARVEQSAATMASKLMILSPEEDEALLREAGFRDVSLFYAAYSFRGWIGYAA
ncbi:methyltransferase [Devosia soli]|uniref:Methyltransferase n=1 Tax=Devosia soli TaxID=361041 RepID=A0A0F5LCH2_9HYPH|nr:class I SAM-dependent methyltransferase [Devosia soli]KKB79980.1 methyltransferase [Devosia soli]